jgi:poly(3-hydroxybutyrate) depolymerase
MIASRLSSPLRLLLSLCAVAIVLAAGPAGAAYVTGDNARSLTHDTELREYNLYAPAAYDGLSPAPRVVG